MRLPNVDQVKTNLSNLTGAPIKEIKLVENDAYEITLNTTEDAQKFLSLNGRNIAGHDQPILASRRDHVLGVLDIFRLVHEKLEMRQRVDDWNGNKNGNNRQARAISKQKTSDLDQPKSPTTPKGSEGVGTPRKEKKFVQA